MDESNSGARHNSAFETESNRENDEIEGRRNRARRLHSRVAWVTRGVRYVDHGQYERLVSEPNPPLVIDVRESEEFATGTLPNAVTLRQATEFLKNQERIRPNSNDNDAELLPDVLCFCTIGLRSGVHALRLKQAGLAGNIWNYSIMTHLWAGGTLVRPDRTRWDNRVHVFSKNYQSVMPEGVVAVAFPVLVAIIRFARQIPVFVLAFLACLPFRRDFEGK